MWDSSVVICEEGEEDGCRARWEVIDAAKGERAEDEGEEEGWEERCIWEGCDEEGL